MLGQILGSKGVSRTVAQNASARTGLDQGVLKKMPPMLAMMVAGYMASQRGARRHQEASAACWWLDGGGAASGQSVLGGLSSMLDTNRDGNLLDDILRMAGSGQC